jgi:hypothetical protein
MTTHPLDSAWQRILRADEHLIDLRQRISNFVEEQHNLIVAQFQTDRPQNIRDIVPVQVYAPMSIAIRIGEICYNLRTALEYLVFELAKLDSGIVQHRTQFPIEDTRRGFEGRIKSGWLNGLNSTHIAAIERLQPYNGCNWTRALREISNKDKHREFPSIKGGVTLRLYSRGDWEFTSLDLPIHRTFHPSTRKEVNVKVDIRSEIAFDDGTLITQALEEIKAAIAKTLADFYLEF